MSWSLHKKHILLILGILIASVEVEGTSWSQLYQTCVSNKIKHAIAMAKNHPIISFVFLFGGSLFIYNKIRDKWLKKYIWDAVNKGDCGMVRCYLGRGLDVHAKNERGEELIHQAVVNDQSDIIKIFFKHDFSVIKSRDIFNNTPLDLAAKFGNKTTVKYLLANFRECNNIDEFTLNNPLYLAVSSGYKGVVEYLISQGANTNVEYEDGKLFLR